MKYKIGTETDDYIDIGDLDNSFFLIGLLNEFTNRFQVLGDFSLQEISWKQYFVLVCIGLCKEPPTLGKLSEVLGSSHQNVKQMLIKLEKNGFVIFIPDKKDKRKQRIAVTEKAKQFQYAHDEKNANFMRQLFQSVDTKNLEITIDTILKVDEQLKKMEDEKRHE